MGLDYLWDEHYPDKYIIDMIQQRMDDMYKQTILAKKKSRSSKGFLHQYLIDNFALQYYLCKPIPSLYKRYISRFRIVSHNLRIEHGKYYNESRIDRKCALCNLNDVEDEYHFILVCPRYSELKSKYIKIFYYMY